MGVYKRGESWYIDFRSANGSRVREVVGPKRAEAHELLGKRLGEKRDEKKFGRKRIDRVLVEDFCEEYLRRSAHFRSQVTLKSGVKDIASYFKGRYVCELTEKDIDDFIITRRDTPTRRGGKRCGSSVNRAMRIFSAMLNSAVRLHIAKRNVASKCRRLQESPGRLRFLSHDEAATMLDFARRSRSRHLYPIIVVALDTGARRGEIFNLRQEDVDFKARQLWIRETKNGTPRHVPMTERVCEVLSKHPRRIDSDYVFPGYASAQLSNTFRKTFADLLQRAGIIGVVFHSLRHTFASHLVMKGVPLYTVGKLLGHRGSNITLRYAHLSPGHLQDAVALLPVWENGRILDAGTKSVG